MKCASRTEEDGVLPAMKMDLATMNSTSDDPLMQDIFKGVSEINKSFPAFDALVQADVNTALSMGIQQVIGGELDAEKMLENVQARKKRPMLQRNNYNSSRKGTTTSGGYHEQSAEKSSDLHRFVPAFLLFLAFHIPDLYCV